MSYRNHPNRTDSDLSGSLPDEVLSQMKSGQRILAGVVTYPNLGLDLPPDTHTHRERERETRLDLKRGSVTSCSCVFDSLQNDLSQVFEFEPAAELLPVQQRRVDDVRMNHLRVHQTHTNTTT